MTKKNSILFIIFFILFIWIQHLSAITVEVVTEEYPPYNYTENGKIIGASTEVVKEVLKRADISYIIKGSPMRKRKKSHGIRSFTWEKAYKIALERSNVLIYSIAKTETRVNLFKWVDIIVPYDVYLYKLKNRKDINIKALYQARDYKIGGVMDSARVQYLKNHNFVSGKNLELVVQEKNNFENLINKKIDLLPMDEIGFTYLVKKNGMKVKSFEKVIFLKELSEGLYMAFNNKTDDSIIETCRKAIKSMKKDGTYQKIINKYIEK